MPTRLRPLLALLPIVALLAVPGAVLAAKTRTKVEPGSTWMSVELPSRDGWQISILTATRGKSRTPVSISANDRAAHASLTYGVHGRYTKDGTIVAKFPDLGRVSLRFDQTKFKKEAARPEPGCTIPHETLVREGTFRGRIKLDDRKGFGSLDLRQASGSITDFAAETCPARNRRAAKHGAAGERKPRPKRPACCRAASTPVARSTAATSRSTPKPIRAYSVRTARRNSSSSRASTRCATGCSTFASVVTPVATKGFDVTPGSEATVEPPAPFHGSATFKIESPTTASWSGDLGVEIPTIGKVDLTAPGTWSTLCEGGSCTETLPTGMRISLLGSD